MNVEFTRKFEKQIDGLRDEKLKKEIASAVRTVIASKQLPEIPNIKKLQGHKTAYRKLPDGILYQNETVYFLAFAHRKDIYKTFP